MLFAVVLQDNVSQFFLSVTSLSRFHKNRIRVSGAVTVFEHNDMTVEKSIWRVNKTAQSVSGEAMP